MTNNTQPTLPLKECATCGAPVDELVFLNSNNLPANYGPAKKGRCTTCYENGIRRPFEDPLMVSRKVEWDGISAAATVPSRIPEESWGRD